MIWTRLSLPQRSGFPWLKSSRSAWLKRRISSSPMRRDAGQRWKRARSSCCGAASVWSRRRRFPTQTPAGPQTPIAVPKKRELSGACTAKVKRMAYHAVNARTSTHLEHFANKSACFSSGRCGDSPAAEGSSPRKKQRGTSTSRSLVKCMLSTVLFEMSMFGCSVRR
jgi:hypothetical protein